MPDARSVTGLTPDRAADLVGELSRSMAEVAELMRQCHQAWTHWPAWERKCLLRRTGELAGAAEIARGWARSILEVEQTLYANASPGLSDSSTQAAFTDQQERC